MFQSRCDMISWPVPACASAAAGGLSFSPRAVVLSVFPPALRLRRGGELVLIALRRDVVDLHLDLVLLTPGVAQLGERVVGPGHPMVPAAEAQCAGRMDAADIGRGDHRGGTERRGLENMPTSGVRASHLVLPLCSSIAAIDGWHLIK